MSRAKLDYTATARRDLDAIAEYLEDQAGRRIAAKWVSDIRARARELRDAPFLGAADEELGGRRRLVVGPYVIIYRVIDSGRVVIIRIADGRPISRRSWIMSPFRVSPAAGLR